MKEQYLGDINDYRKYALLRVLSNGGDLSIGVCWMLTPPDGGGDGLMLRYLQDPATWRHHDPELFDLLKLVTERPEGRRQREVESRDVVPGAGYFNSIVPDDAPGRAAYFEAAKRTLAPHDLVFFDPDNGFEVSAQQRGRRNSSKYIWFDEIADFYERGQSVLVYQHFPREKRDRFTRRRLAELQTHCFGSTVVALMTPHVAFFLALHPSHKSLSFKRDLARLLPIGVSIFDAADG